jgi:two-component system, chemotaxis family, chemotaxis protein CheY
MKILVVDDSSTMRRIITNALKDGPSSGVVEAEDGVQGLARLKGEGDVGLILTDWNMPNMDGFEFLTKVREQDRDIPIIMITTEAEKANVMRAIKAGANSYIVKPFSPEVLTEKIGPYLN